MTNYEVCRLMAEPVFPRLQGDVRGTLKRLLRSTSQPMVKVWDVGGRKSPYTIGLPVALTIIDVPRHCEVQEALHLGMDKRILEELRRRRCNLESVVLEDITQCTLPSASFDGVYLCQGN